MTRSRTRCHGARPTRRRAAVRALSLTCPALLAGLLAACGATPGDRAGGAPKPTVLVMANNDGALDGAPAVARFVREAERRSGGTLRIEVRSSWQGGSNEPRVLRDVMAGDADLGWSGTRALDHVGIDDFRPVHAPFLVGSYAAEAALLRDPVAADMLGALRTHSLVGLGLLADQLRMVAAVRRPILEPADLRGMRIGVVPSRQGVADLVALGASPRPLPSARGAGVESLDALETMWWTYQANQQWKPFRYVTADLVLWPRTTVLVANPARFDALSAAQRSWLRAAAADARAWSAEHASDEVTAQVRTACDGGAEVATVGQEGLTAFRRAARPAYEALGSDPVARDRLARIQSLVDRVSPSARPVPDVPPSCRYQPGGAAQSPALIQLRGPGDPGPLPLGTYRFTRTEEQLVAAGMPPYEAAVNAGVWTWTFGRGTWHFELQPSTGTTPPDTAGDTCDGWLDVTGDLISLTTVTVYPTGECAPKVFTLRWRRQGTDLVIGEMTERGNAHGAPDPLWSGFPWKRID